jgi:hypothetical protein
MFNGQHLGINVPIVWIAGLLALELIAWRNLVPFQMETRILLWLSVPFSVFIAFRDSTTLQVLNLGSIALVGLIVALRNRSGKIAETAVTEYLIGVFPVAFEIATGLVTLLSRQFKSTGIRKPRPYKKIAILFRGVLIATPLVVLFGALFSSADAAFAKIVSDLFQWKVRLIWGETWQPIAWIIVISGFLKVVLIWNDRRNAPEKPMWGSLGAGEVTTVLALLNILFFVFVAVQFRFLFGFHNGVQAMAGMSYAQYARSGFFELVWVTLLVLPVMLMLDWVFISKESRQLMTFRLLSLTLILQLFVVMTSALHRMQLYVSAFGLSELRFYVTIFMFWLAFAFIWFAFTVLVGRRNRFAFGAMVAALVTVAALNVINPDTLIAAYNAADKQLAGGFDSDYATTLSADSVPYLLRWESRAPNNLSKYELASYLIQSYSPQHYDWRSWNAYKIGCIRKL